MKRAAERCPFSAEAGVKLARSTTKLRANWTMTDSGIYGGGISAALAQMLMEPYSSAPLIGASGAISGVLGAFFICNPAARITLVLDPALICFLRRLTIRMPACLGSPTGVVFLTDFHGSE